MVERASALRAQLERQVVHWSAAADALADLERVASSGGWAALEAYLGRALRESLDAALDRLRRQRQVLVAQLNAAETVAELREVQSALIQFRARYLAVEVLVDFYCDAINTRGHPEMGAYLRACDTLAVRSMRVPLDVLGKPTPPVLTYVDRGLGASILKAGLRLWDGRSLSAVATIKIARHNLQRPTALLHEAGHQVAHLTGWMAELGPALAKVGGGRSTAVGAMWAHWASETAADAFAFAHAGYAAVAAVHDVLAGEPRWVLRIDSIDPHPPSFLRVLLGIEMCRRFYGAGAWDEAAGAWSSAYPIRLAGERDRSALQASLELLPSLVDVLLAQPFRCFGGRCLAELVDPTRVKPEALFELERSAGAALYRSSDWLWREGLRLLALSGYRFATVPTRIKETVALQTEWMHRLGGLARAA